MYKIIIGLLIFFTIPNQISAQILPKEGSKLNYRIIGFSFPKEHKESKYRIEIAPGFYTNNDSFKTNIIASFQGDNNKIIGEVPAFGKQYTWCAVYIHKNATQTKSKLYHFSTGINRNADTAKLRIRILHAAEQHKDDYVSVDAGGVLYDMNGHPVWYVIDTNGIDGYDADMQFTPGGTITFLSKKPYEINYNGEILWKTHDKGIVSGDITRGEYYHHGFTKLSNGHYMVLGTQVLMCKLVTSNDSSYIIVSSDRKGGEGYRAGRFGTIIEYDKEGNVVWSWLSSKYLIGSDFDYYESRIDSNKRCDPHDNAFFFDEKNKVIYLCFRNLNRIMKIEYPSGKVLDIYGENFKQGVQSKGKSLFCNPHGIRKSMDGYLYFFNNNSCQIIDSFPTVVMLHEPTLPSDTLKKVWEYTCTVEGNYLKKFGSGGNVIELPDRSLFVCMGSEYSKLFIVNRAKKILWSALPERFMEPDNVWVPIHEFSANIISRKDLERMIWNAEFTTF